MDGWDNMHRIQEPPQRHDPIEDIMPPRWMICFCLFVAIASAFFVATLDPFVGVVLVVTFAINGLVLRILLKRLPR